jgi:hypothetical protein
VETYYHSDKYGLLIPGTVVCCSCSSPIEHDLTRVPGHAPGASLRTTSEWGHQVLNCEIDLLDGPEGLKTVTMELVLESTRQGFFPSQPSRLRSLFGCRTLDEAKAFASAHRVAKSQHIVRILSESAPRFDMNWLDDWRFGADWLEMSYGYWTGEGKGHTARWEHLIAPRAYVEAIECQMVCDPGTTDGLAP